MSQYFFQETALEELEREMMMIPGFDHGSRTVRPDAECSICVCYHPEIPCVMSDCRYFADRINSGELTFRAFVEKLYRPFPQIQSRLCDEEVLSKPIFFRHEVHWERWWRWRDRFPEMSKQQKAAMYLLAAYEPVWAAMIWHMSKEGFDFQNVHLGSLTIEQYDAYQAAKCILTGSRSVTAGDLADRMLISEETFWLITGALLIACFGEVVLETKK